MCQLTIKSFSNSTQRRKRKNRTRCALINYALVEDINGFSFTFLPLFVHQFPNSYHGQVGEEEDGDDGQSDSGGEEEEEDEEVANTKSSKHHASVSSVQF